jgi:sec-independent protein translocase protein TatA
MFSTPDLLVIFAVVLVVFGAGKLPEIGKSLGKGIRDFKKATEEGGKILKEPLEKVKDIPKLVESTSEAKQEPAKPAESKVQADKTSSDAS